MAGLRAADPGREVEAWCEDEARLGLKPVARRVWAPKGTRPACSGRHRFESLYVYGFAHPATGRSLCLLLPRLNAELMSEALAAFARWADPEGRKTLVLLVDNAGAHTAGSLAVPPNVRLFPLPPRTPELQPAERLWPLVREALASRAFDHMVGLAGVLRARCDWLAGHPEVVKGATGFHWATRL